MAMFSTQEDYCGWCGKPDASSKCACGRISSCGRSCQKNAWKSEHRFVCTAERPASKHQYYPGDVVRIQGLQSATGQKMNGSLAEVQETLTGDRVQVILTVEQDSIKSIKTVALKPQNLAVVLSAREAALRAAEVEPLKELDITIQDEKLKKCVEVAQTIPSLSGAEIVRRLDEGDEFLLLALVLPTELGSKRIPSLSHKQYEEMCDSGLVETCLGRLHFPESIDVELEQPTPGSITTLLHVLGNSLSLGSFGDFKESKLNKVRVEVCRRLGPAIMVCATKKRRLYRRTVFWLEAWMNINAVLASCMLAAGAASKVLLREVDPSVTTAVNEHVVSSLTMDISRYQCDQLNHSIHEHAPTCKAVAVQVLQELVDIQSVGLDTVRHVGELVISAGAPGLTGRKFAECFLDVTAKVAVEVLSADVSLPHQIFYQQFKYIYGCLGQCPYLIHLLGDFDEDFTSVTSDQQLLRWARQHLAAE